MLLSLTANAQTDESTFKLDNVPLSEFVRIVFSDFLKKDYLTDNDFNNEKRTVSVTLQDRTKKQVYAVAKKVLNENDYVFEEIDGVFYISKKREVKHADAELKPYYYKPKNRDVSYLTTLLQGIFINGRFSYQRGIKSPTMQPNTNQETDTNALGQIDKSDQDAFIFLGTDIELVQLKKLLTQLDTPVPQVMVKAYLYEVSKSESGQSAFKAALDLLGNAFNVTLAVPTLGNSLSISLGGIDAVYSALNTDSRFNVISTSSLMVKDRQQGRFQVGSEVPVLGNVSYQQNGAAVQSVEYRSSGVILDLMPKFSEEIIELNVNQVISNFVQTKTGVNNSPTLLKREVSTVINAHDGDIIILGGLDESRQNADNATIPFLPRFFGSRSNDSLKSDILLVLQVHKI